MSEDEMITNANELIDNCNCYLEDDKTDDETFKWFDMEKKTIQNLLDLYQKEKEKNKELENADLTTVYLNGFYDGEKKWKDRISGKIEELDIEIQQCEYADDDIEEYKNDMEKEKSRLLRNKKILQELLEENNGKQM